MGAVLHIPDSSDGWAHHALSHGSDMVGVVTENHMLSAVKGQRGGEGRVEERENDDEEEGDIKKEKEEDE